jgi:hypothetical protein
LLNSLIGLLCGENSACFGIHNKKAEKEIKSFQKRITVLTRGTHAIAPLAGWPDWANIWLLVDCLLWAVF